MGFFNKATICLNGHLVSSTKQDYSKHCNKCGSETTSLCSNCNNYIKGAYENEWSLEFNYSPPAFCEKCGKPYPWTATIIENAIEIISLDEHLPDEFKQTIKDAIPDLIVDSVMAPVATAKYRKFTQKAADYTKDGLKNLLVDVVSETVKKSIWG